MRYFYIGEETLTIVNDGIKLTIEKNQEVFGIIKYFYACIIHKSCYNGKHPIRDFYHYDDIYIILTEEESLDYNSQIFEHVRWLRYFEHCTIHYDYKPDDKRIYKIDPKMELILYPNLIDLQEFRKIRLNKLLN